MAGPLGLLGIQARPYRGLVRAFLASALRCPHYARATGTKACERVSPLLWVVGQYLVLSGLASALLFVRVNPYFFALSGLGISMGLLAVALLVEFQEVVVHPDDWETVSHRPVSSWTYAAARLTALVTYVLLFTTSLNLFPLIVGVAVPGSGVWWVPAYLCACLAGNLAVTALVVLLHGVASRLGERTRELLAWTQIAALMVVFYGGQAVLRDPGSGLWLFAYNPPFWVSMLPFAWLARFVAAAAAGQEWLAAALTALGVALALSLTALHALSALYGRVAPRQAPTVTPAEASRSLRDYKAVRAGRDREWAVGRWLGGVMLRRDPEVAGRALPYLGMAFGGLVLGLAAGQMQDPFVSAWPHSAMAGMLPLLLVLAAPAATQALANSRDHAAAWVLQTAPMRRHRRVASGAARAVEDCLFRPAFVAVFLLLAWLWRDVVHALVHCLLGWLALRVVMAASVGRFLRGLPFSRPARLGDLNGPLAGFEALAAVGLCSLGAAEAVAYRSLAGTAGLTAAMVAAALWVGREG